MKHEYETWLKRNAPAGQPWKGRLLTLAAAGTATALVGLSVVLMAGLGLPSGEFPVEAKASAGGQNVRYAQALPTVTVVGRREPVERAPMVEPAVTAGLPIDPTSRDAATVGMSSTGDNLRQ